MKVTKRHRNLCNQIALIQKYHTVTNDNEKSYYCVFKERSTGHKQEAIQRVQTQIMQTIVLAIVKFWWRKYLKKSQKNGSKNEGFGQMLQKQKERVEQRSLVSGQ